MKRVSYRSAMVSSLLAALVLVGLLGCGGDTGQVAAPEPGTEDASRATQTKTEPQDVLPEVDQLGLVQVLIYGLAAWEFEPKFQKHPSAVHVHFPEVNSPRHTMDLSWGYQRGWNVLAKDFGGKTITLGSGNALVAFQGAGSLGEYPKTPEESMDVRWMLGADDFEPTGTVKGTDYKYQHLSTTAHINLDGGTLETCGLVHSKDIKEVCRVDLDSSGLKTSASEYMVLRYEVKNMSAILVDVGGTKHPIVPTEGSSVFWGGTTYTQVFDVRLRNASKPSGRVMKTLHANKLQDFYPKAMKSWYVSSSDYTAGKCRSKTTEATPRDLQAPCLLYFKKEYGEPSGTKRPICPFVEHP